MARMIDSLYTELVALPSVQCQARLRRLPANTLLALADLVHVDVDGTRAEIVAGLMADMGKAEAEAEAVTLPATPNAVAAWVGSNRELIAQALNCAAESAEFNAPSWGGEAGVQFAAEAEALRSLATQFNTLMGKVMW